MTGRTPRPSLTRRLLTLTVGFIASVQLLVLIPLLGRERTEWFRERATEAHIAALAVKAAPDGMLDASTRDALLRLSGTDRIRVAGHDGAEIVVQSDRPATPDAAIDLAAESFLGGIRHAVSLLLTPGERLLEVTLPSPIRDAAEITVQLHERRLARQLREVLLTIVLFSLGIAAATGGVLYILLSWLLVNPMRRIVSSIAGFRADPERALPIAAPYVARDEIGQAAVELRAMQRELRGALWRNARLAALGTAVAKISHDVRGILSSALLVADRLAASSDPAVRRSGEVLVDSVQRASDLIRSTLDFAREGPPPLKPERFGLRAALIEAAEAAPRLRIDLRVPASATVEADREALGRVVTNLLRNAAQASARGVRIAARAADGAMEIEIADDGPGLPEPIVQNLFKPFAPGGRRGGSGLGLAIAHDLMRALGGEIRLAHTGSDGTTFVLRIPDAEVPAEPAPLPVPVPAPETQSAA